MSLLRSPLLAIGLVIILALPAAPGQEGGKVSSSKAVAAPRVARLVYTIRGGQAKELANALILHFKTEPTFLAVPAPGSNSLLLSGPKSVLDDARDVLREIDRPARAVHVDVFLIELSGKTGAEASADSKDIERIEWAGPARNVTAKIRDLQKQGLIVNVQRIQLTALEGHGAQAQARESSPYTTGATVTGGFGGGGFLSGARGAAGGRRGSPGGGGIRGGDGAPPGGSGMISRLISYRDLGTSVQVTPGIGADGLVVLELRIEDSRMRTAQGVTIATDEKGMNVPATEFITSTLESRLKVRPGHVVVAKGTATTSKLGQAQTLVLVSAISNDADN
jgi:hypothetical protein